jgi:hypothetical protein
MRKPDPIEGWSFEVDGLPGKLQWRARWSEEDHVAWFDAEGFHVEDSLEYDGRQHFDVPIAVLDTLRQLQEGEDKS